MSDFSLYKSCKRKVVINLRDRIYKRYQENPFSAMPTKIVNDIMSKALKHQRANGFRTDDLELLLTSGKLQVFKFSYQYEKNLNTMLSAIIQVLNFLKSGCQKLEILHLTCSTRLRMAWLQSKASVARTRSQVFTAQLGSKISELLGNLLTKTPNLEELHCIFTFDLKALRNCRELRRLRLHFEPQQHWYEFLEEESGVLQTHKRLEYFTLCHEKIVRNVAYDDIVIMLRHCPELISLGFIESSGALSQLQGMDISPSELKLRHCFWTDRGNDEAENPSQPSDNRLHLVSEAVLNYPTVEELDFAWCSLRSLMCLIKLRNLVYLNITLGDDVSSGDFNNALQAIGPQLKHLCFNTNNPMDLSLLLRNCRNLESLKIIMDELPRFANPSVSLPNLQRLAIDYTRDNGGRVFLLLSECNRLTELFLPDAIYFDDQTLHHFLDRNSLSNLKVAFLPLCGLTENGFRELLLHSPQLERVKIDRTVFGLHFWNPLRRIISETNHKALCNRKDSPKANDEFFQKRTKHNFNVNSIGQ